MVHMKFYYIQLLVLTISKLITRTPEMKENTN